MKSKIWIIWSTYIIFMYFLCDRKIILEENTFVIKAYVQVC